MKKKISKISIFLLAFFAFGFVFCFAQDDPLKELEDFRKKTEECQKISDPQEALECIYKVQNDLQSWMEKTEKEIQQKLETLSQEKISLKRQIEYLDSQIAYNNLKIKYTQDQINLLSFDIENTKKYLEEAEKRIQNLDEKIKETKKNLSLSLRDFYTSDQGKEILRVLFEKASLADVFLLKTYYEKFQKKIENLLAELENEKANQQKIKEDLLKQKKDLERKKEDLERYKASLEDIKQKLAYDKRQKEVLLEITKGDEKRFQEIMEKVRKEVDALGSNISSIITLYEKQIAEYLKDQKGPLAEKCAKYYWFYFSQTDPRWAETGIGGTRYKMKDWGCAIASTAMILKYYGKDVDPGKIASFPACPGGCGISYGCECGCDDFDKFFTSGGCIYWGKVALHYGMDVDSWVSPSLLDAELKKHPVIAMTRSDRVLSHFIVIVDKDEKDYIVLDPYKGILRDGTPVGGCVYLHQSLAYAANGGKGSIVKLVVFWPQ